MACLQSKRIMKVVRRVQIGNVYQGNNYIRILGIFWGLVALIVLMTALYSGVKQSDRMFTLAPLNDKQTLGNNLKDLFYWGALGMLLSNVQYDGRMYRQTEIYLSPERLLLTIFAGSAILILVASLGTLVFLFLVPRLRFISYQPGTSLAAIFVPIIFIMGYYEDVWTSSIWIIKNKLLP